MKKRWTMFRLTEGGVIAVYILLCIYAGRVVLTAGIAVILLSVYWCWYYYNLEYTLSNNILYITSGILFRKQRTIPMGNILWEMQLTSPFFSGSAMSVLHTSGGNAVVFCDLSTHRR